MEAPSVTIQLTPADLAIYLREVAQKRNIWGRLMVFVAIGVMIGVGYMLRLGASDGAEAGAPSSVLSAPLILILVSLVLIGWNRWRVRRRSFWPKIFITPG